MTTTTNKGVQEIADELRSEAPKLGFCYNQLDDANLENVVRVVIQRVLDHMVLVKGEEELYESDHIRVGGMLALIDRVERQFDISTAADYFVKVQD